MYQQRRTAPAVSAYESQAARWKQGFSAPGQPGHPQQQQHQAASARHSDLEGVLIGELCSSIGSSSFPPRDVLQKLVRYLPSLDHSYVCELLDDKLQHRLWQVQGKALSVLDAVLKTPHAEPYKLHYHTRIALLHELGHSRKDIVKNRAEKVLAVISAFVPPAPAAHELPSQEHALTAQAHHQPASHVNDYHHAQYQQHQQQEIDLLQGFDDPDEDGDHEAATGPEPAAQSAFGFISAAAAPAPEAGPVPTAPPMTESSFGFLNAPATAPAPAAPAAHATTAAAAPDAHLSSTSPPPHDRPLTIKDLSTSMHQQPRAQQQQQLANSAVADIPTASAFAFMAAAAAANALEAPVAPLGLPRPVDIWDVLPAPTPTVGLALSASESASAPPTDANGDDDATADDEEKAHDPIHDAFEGLDASSASDIDALDHTHVSLATPYPPREAIVQTREPLREVILDIELPPGPMGVVLDRTITDMAVIERFIPLPSGERGYLEMHPAICPGCALVSVNSVSVEDKGLDEVGPVLAAFAQVPKVLRFRKLMNNGRTANPSTLLMPYIPPPSEEEEAAKRESSEHMTRLTEFSASLDDVESTLDDLERRAQLHLPIVDKKNQLAQLHGTVEKIQTQGIDAVILGPNPPPNFDEVKKFRSSLVRRADALTKRIQAAAEPPPAAVVAPAASPAHDFAAAVAPVGAAATESSAVASPVSAFSFVAGAPAVVPPSMASLSLPPVAETPASSFHFLNPSTPPVQPPPAPGTSSFAFMEESSEPPASSFAFLQKPPMPAAAATPASVASVFAGLSVKEEPASVHAASTVSAGPLTLSALGMASSTASVSTLAASGPSGYLPTPTPTPMSSLVHNAHGDTSSTTSSAFGFLSALEDTGVSSAPTAMSSQSAFGFMRASGDSSSTSLNSSSSSATSETPPAPASASAFAFISS